MKQCGNSVLFIYLYELISQTLSSNMNQKSETKALNMYSLEILLATSGIGILEFEFFISWYTFCRRKIEYRWSIFFALIGHYRATLVWIYGMAPISYH